ncbi:MAG: hypothetical protein ACLVJH_09460 [Faecalibacterium prausnitzii]
MAPEPVRGTRCDSSLIRYVGEYIAQRARAFSRKRCSAHTAANATAGYTGCNPFSRKIAGHLSLCFCINQQSKSKLL